MADLSSSTNWSEIDASNNLASPNGWPEGMMPSGVNDSARNDKGALKRFWNRANPVQQITPAGNVWTFTTGNPTYPTAYVEGEIFRFRAGADNAAGASFQVNALGAKPIYKRLPVSPYWGPVVVGDIVNQTYVTLIYQSSLNAGAGAFVLVNPFLYLQGDATGLSVPGNLGVTGNTTLSGQLHTVGATTLDSSLVVGGATGLNGTLQVNGGGAAALNVTSGGGSIAGGLSVGQALTVGGLINGHQLGPCGIAYPAFGGHNIAYQWNGTNLYSYVDCNNVGALAFLSQPASFGALTVTGGYTQSGTGANTFTGGVIMSGGLNVTGGGLQALGMTGTSLTLSGGGSSVLNVTSGGISVAGASTFPSLTLSGGGAAVLNVPNGGITVAGSSTFNGGITTTNLTASGTATAQTLQINGNGTVNGGFSVGGNIGTNGFIQINGGGTALHLLAGDIVSDAGSGYFGKSNATALTVVGAGNAAINVTNGGVTASGFNLSSDIRLKTKVKSWEQGLDAIRLLRPISFEWAGELRPDSLRHVSFAAQSVGEILPEAVSEVRDLLRLDSHVIVCALVNAVQELCDRIIALEASRA